MQTTVIIIHLIACVALILIVLLQAGKGSGISGLFGNGGGSDQLFSAPSGLAFIKKITVAMAILFMVSSLFMTIVSSRFTMRSVTSQIPYVPVTPPSVPPVK